MRTQQIDQKWTGQLGSQGRASAALAPSMKSPMLENAKSPFPHVYRVGGGRTRLCSVTQVCGYRG